MRPLDVGLSMQCSLGGSWDFVRKVISTLIEVSLVAG